MRFICFQENIPSKDSSNLNRIIHMAALLQTQSGTGEAETLQRRPVAMNKTPSEIGSL